MKDIKEKMSKFSVQLGLFDYINPICYSITTIILAINSNKIMQLPYSVLFIIGAIISLIFGLTIPTVKLLVGLGKMKFKMPVNLVFYVNFGIIISGFSLLNAIFNLSLMLNILMLIGIIVILLAIYLKTKKFNTVAVLTGIFGYMFIYLALITIAFNKNIIISVILYCISVICSLFLCGIGIKANLKDAKIHWVIESVNVLCQFLVALSTILLFRL